MSRHAHVPAWLCVAALALLALPADARAQGYISPLIGFDFGGDSGCPAIDDCEDKNLNAGVAIGRMGAIAGFEVEFAYAKDFFGEAAGLDSSVLTLMGNVMINPDLDPFRPYVTAGLGLIRTDVELSPSGVVSSQNSHVGWNLGGGLMIFFGDHVGIRGDLRFFHAFQDLDVLGLSIEGEKLDFGRAAGALVLRF